MKKRISFVSLLAVWASIASAQAPAVNTAKAGIERLIRGNEAYTSARTDTSQWGPERRLAVAAGQHPFATILTCSDSRVPPEDLQSRLG